MADLTFFTPGPSQLTPNIDEYLRDAIKNNIMSVSHRSQDFSNLYKDTENNLLKLLNAPVNYKMLLVGSATEAMERITLSSAVKTSQHYINGAFGQKWHNIAKGLGKTTYALQLDTKLWQYNSLDLAPAELTCFTNNETSTGILMPNKIINNLAKQAKKQNSIVAIDMVSSAPFVSFNWSLVDYAFFSVQKAFGLPAGLGVIIANPNTAAKTLDVIKKTNHASYASIAELMRYGQKYQTPATPNALGLYLLNKVTKNYLADPNLLKNHLNRAKKLYQIISGNKNLSVAVNNTNWQSNTVVVANVNGGNANLIANAKKAGLVIGTGYKEQKQNQIRIANFPATSAQSFNKLCSYLSSY